MGRCSMTYTTWFFYSETECECALVVSLIIRRLVLFNIFWSPSVKFLVSSVNRSAASHSSCSRINSIHERSWRIEAAAEVLLDFTQLNMQTQHEHQSTAGFDRQNLLDIQLRAAPWKQDAQWRSSRPVYRAQRMLADFPSLATPEGDKRSESQYGVCR